MDTRFEHIDDEQCLRFSAAIETVGRRWSSSILMALARGATRFSEVLTSVPGLSDRLLAQRLKELEADRLITREVIASTPVQVRYRLTMKGHDLMRALQPLVAYGQRWEPGARVPA